MDTLPFAMLKKGLKSTFLPCFQQNSLTREKILPTFFEADTGEETAAFQPFSGVFFAVVDDTVNHAEIIFHSHFCILQVIVQLQNTPALP